MNRVLLPLLALLVLASIALPNTAQAYIITVNFTVTGGATDPLHGADIASGSFSFDSSLIPGALPGVIAGGPYLPTNSFNLTWAGHAYTTADAGIALLGFDAAGKLNDFDLISGDLSLVGGTDDIDVRANANGFTYSYVGAQNIYTGTVAYTVDYGNAPEPGSLALVAPALLAFGLIRRRRS